MKVPTRNAALLLLAYLAGVVALYLWIASRMEKAAWHIMEDTARLLGQEVSSAVARVIPEDAAGQEAAQRKLHQRALALVATSAMVERAVIVDASGKVVMPRPAEDEEEVGLPTPAELFAVDRRPRLFGVRGSTLGGSQFTLDIPILRNDVPIAYLHLTLQSSRISSLYADARDVLLMSTGLGLLIIGALGFALHLQLARRERLAILSLEGALAGTPTVAAGAEEEPSSLLSVAERLGETLRAERSRALHAHETLAHLGRLLDVGVLLLKPDGEFEFVGHRAVSLLGMTGNDDQPRLEGFLLALAPAVDRVREAGAGLTVDLDLPTGSGAPTSLRCTVLPFRDGGGDGFVIMLRDRALLRALATDLRQAAQLRWLARYHLGAAHELKTPLNAMTLNLEVLKHTIEHDGEDAHEALHAGVEVLEHELRRLRQGVETLLSQAAPSIAAKIVFDLRDLLCEIERLIGMQARHQRVVVTVEVGSVPAPVNARRDLIKQALLNVATNALEAMPEGGTLAFHLVVDGEEARIRIEDTGGGIPAAVSARIFDMHVTTKASGTGIGLFVARSALEDESGFLRLEASGPGGTTFELGLPLAVQSQKV